MVDNIKLAVEEVEVLEGKNSPDPYSDSPLDSGSGLTVAAGTYPVTVGAGGAKGLTPAQNDNSGANSILVQ